MELKELLALKTPTVAQYEETEKLLHAAITEAKAEIDHLDAEDAAHALDRVTGEDKGRPDRLAARAAAVGRMDDLTAVRGDVMGKASALEARIEKEKETAAWKVTEAHLDRRSALLRECEEALDHAAAAYIESEAAFKDARKSAPVDLSGGRMSVTQGGAPGIIGAAVIGRLHAMIGRPLAVHHIEGTGQLGIFEREGVAGLDQFAQPTANLLMAPKYGG